MINSDPGSNKHLGALVKSMRCDQTGVAPPPPPKKKKKTETYYTVIPNRRPIYSTNSSALRLAKMTIRLYRTWGPVPFPNIDEIVVTCKGVTKLLKSLKTSQSNRARRNLCQNVEGNCQNRSPLLHPAFPSLPSSRMHSIAVKEGTL